MAFAGSGVSSPQLDQSERGFSFMHDGPLDMRMDVTTRETASAWLARVSFEELRAALKTYGEERGGKDCGSDSGIER